MTLEPIIVGVLSAVAAMLGVAFWQLLVRPEALLGFWADPRGDGEEWVFHHPGAVRALRVAVGVVLFLSGFLTGLALTFLLGT